MSANLSTDLDSYQSWLEAAATQIGQWLLSPPDNREETDLRSLSVAVTALRRIIDTRRLLTTLKEEENERANEKSDEDPSEDVFTTMEEDAPGTEDSGDEREVSPRSETVRRILPPSN